MEGSHGNDTYIFNKGDGEDTIIDYSYFKSNSPMDKILFGEGITAENIIFSRDENNLVISYGSEGDTITVVNHYAGGSYEIECFETSDGYSISNTQVNLLIQSMAGFETDTGMSWTEAAEQPDEQYSGIVSEMWVKTA